MALALVAVAFLLTYLVHSTLLLGGAWVLSTTGLVRSPRAADVLWKVCLVGGLLTATAQVAGPSQRYGRRLWLPGAAQSAPTLAAASPRPTVGPAQSASRRAPPLGGAVPRAARATVARSAVAIPASAAPALHTLDSAPGIPGVPIWIGLVLGIWLAGALGLLARLSVRRHRFFRRLAARHEVSGGALTAMLESLRADAGVRRRIRLRVSAELSGPVATGASEICLPERALTALTPAEQRAVLAHELGHLVRRDPWWLAFAVVMENLFFLQPLNRMARRRGQEAAELICDDWAVRQTGASLTLAKCLAEVAGWMQLARQPVPLSGMAENPSQLVRRVRRLLDGAEPATVRRVRLALPVAVLALATVAFAAPGVLPPPVSGPARAAAPRAAGVAERLAAGQGEPHTWARVRHGRLITFRPGFAPRITGAGRIGFRRGGRAIEPLDGQRVELNGRAISGADVAVRNGDTLRITNDDGSVAWTLSPVQLSPAQARAWEEPWPGADSDDALATLDAAGRELDLAHAAGSSLDGADAAELALAAQDLGDSVARMTADLAPVLARIGPRVAARVQRDLDRMTPQLARLQDAGVRAGLRIAATMQPRLAELGARLEESVADEVGASIARAFGDSAACDSDASARPSRTKPKHR